MYCYIPYRIPFSETDQMAIVHHSNHARYFERGRVEFLRLVGLGYKELVARGAHFPLTEMSIRYRKPLRFDDNILIEAKITNISETRLSFSYRILLNEVGFIEGKIVDSPLELKELVEARTDHCCVNDSGRPIPIPKDVWDALYKLWMKE